jgi:hypothetical protein
MAKALFSRDRDIKTYVALTPAARVRAARAIPIMAEVRAFFPERCRTGRYRIH